ncbi:MAG: SGNH/GDSL hydrolase family protein [Bacteroidia bacterium]
MNVVFLGESTIAGVGIEDHAYGIAGSFAHEYSQQTNQNLTWTVIAKSGFTAAEVTESLIAKLPQEHIDLIVIGLGGNDSFALHTPNRWVRDIHALIAAIQQKAPDTPILFVNLPPVGEFPAFPGLLQWMMAGICELLRKALIKIADQTAGVWFFSEPVRFDAWKHEAPHLKSIDDFFSDGVHPAAITYQIWGKQIANYWLSLDL